MTTTAEKATTIDKRRALGRGLDSLLPSGPRVVAGTAVADHSVVLPDLQAQAARKEPGESVLRVALDQIDENPYQTRRVFEQTALQELADSIRTNGVVQPVVVRPQSTGRFVLILGERRCRAAKLAGELTIPAIVRQVSNQEAAEMTVVENLQRQDLNCLEQANAFARLSRDFGLTQEQIGKRTGCSRESVANYLRLLKLPLDVQQYVAEGKLGFSEARVLLQLSNPDLISGVARQTIDAGFSVAQLTNLVNHRNFPPAAPTPPVRVVDANVRAAEVELERSLGCKVRISDQKGKGHITIRYRSLEDFDRVMEMLGRE